MTSAPFACIPAERYQAPEFYAEMFGLNLDEATRWRSSLATRHADKLIRSGGQEAVAKFYGAEYAAFSAAQLAATMKIEAGVQRLRHALESLPAPAAVNIGGDPESLALEREMGDDGYREGGGHEIYGGDY